jgi:hypothetical protein
MEEIVFKQQQQQQQYQQNILNQLISREKFFESIFVEAKNALQSATDEWKQKFEKKILINKN